MKKKILQTGLALLLSLALLPSCKEDITNADENKKVLAPAKTECQLIISGITINGYEFDTTLPYDSLLRNNVWNDTIQYKAHVNGAVIIKNDTILCDHTKSSSGSSDQNSYSSYSSYDHDHLLLKIDYNKRIISKLDFYFRSSSSSASGKWDKSSSAFEKFIRLKNVQFTLDKDSSISISLSSVDINTAIDSVYQYSDKAFTKLSYGEGRHVRFENYQIPSTAEIKINIK